MAEPSHFAQMAIVGAGPIGLELAVALERVGADYIHFDANQIGHTIAWWPRDTQFFSTSECIAAITGHRDVPIGTIPARTYDLLLSDIEDN